MVHKEVKDGQEERRGKTGREKNRGRLRRTLSEESREAFRTVRFVFILSEAVNIEVILAKGTHKMLHMPLGSQRAHTLPGDWLLATGADGPRAHVVMRFAKRHFVHFIEAAVLE